LIRRPIKLLEVSTINKNNSHNNSHKVADWSSELLYICIWHFKRDIFSHKIY